MRKTKKKNLTNKHKYLNDIGISSTDCCIFNTRDEDYKSPRLDRFLKQRTKYGFDERETWSLDYTLATWLYSHLMMYKEIGGEIINLTFYSFDVPVLYDLSENEKVYTRNGNCYKFQKEVIENHTEIECIDLACDYLKNYIVSTTSGSLEKAIRANECMTCAMKIVTEIIQALWW